MYGTAVALSLACLPWTASAFAVDPDAAFDHIASTGELSSNYVRSIYRDWEGFVWIGTNAGLDRFDGVEVRRYHLPAVPGVTTPTSVSDIGANDSNLLVINRNNLYEYERRVDSLQIRFRTPENTTCTAVLAPQESDLILVGTSSGLYMLDKGFVLKQVLLPQEYIVGVEHCASGIVVLTPDGLYLLQTGPQQETSIESLLPAKSDMTFTCMACNSDTVFVGTPQKGVYMLKSGRGALTAIPQIKSDIISALFFKDGWLYIGSNGMGLTCYQTATERTVSYANRPELKMSIASNSIYSLFVDDLDILWVGFYSHGVSYTSDKVHVFNQLRPLEGNSIRSFIITAPDCILAGTRNGLIYSHEGVNHTYKAEGHSQIIRSDIVLSLSHYAGREYIVGTFGGGLYLYSIPGQSVRRYPLNQQAHDLLSRESVYGSHYRDGKLYLVTLSGLVVIEAGYIAAHFTDSNSPLPSSHIYSSLDDGQLLWLGTRSGLCCYDYATGTLSKVVFEGLANDFRINCIYRDSRGALWLCADKYGLLKYTPGERTIDNIGHKAGMSSDLVSSIVEAGDGHHYWISTGKGIYRYNILTGGFKLFGEEQGLSKVSFCPGAGYKSDSTFYFGSEDGLIYFTDLPSTLPPDASIAVTDMWIDGKKITYGDKRFETGINGPWSLSLKEGQELRLRIVVPEFRDVRAKTFAYTLTPGEEWTYTYDNYLDFKNIAQGSYTLTVMCSDDEITWGAPQLLLDIHVRRPFHRTGWCFSILLLVVLVACGLLWHWATRIRVIYRVLKKSRTLKKKRKNSDSASGWTQQASVRIKEYMEAGRPYINPDFSIKELSDGVGFSIHQISHVLNNVMGTNFSAFVNNYRVEEVKRMLQSEDVNRLTLFAIAEKCGFSSKTSFYRVFKAITGLTPQEYSKKIRERV